MSWTEQLIEAAYTSPGGTRMTFGFDEELSRSTALKTAENTFPDLDGAEVQPLGTGGKKFPLVAIFSGGESRADADKFEELLCERGYGILEHPIYGKHQVVPTGEIGRSDNLVSGLNESTVKVTFAETITDRAFPDSTVSAQDALSEAVDGYAESATSEFAGLIEVSDVDDQMQLQSVLKTQTDTLFKGMSSIVEQTEDVEEKQSLLQKLSNYKTSVSNWIGRLDQIAGNAQEIATVLIMAARIPARIGISALAKVEGYASVIKDMIANVKQDPVSLKALANQYAATSTMLGALVAALGSGIAETASGISQSGGSQGGFVSRAAMIATCELIEEQFDVYTAYVDGQVEKNAFVDTGEGYADLLDVVVSSIQVLESVAFELPATRTIVLGRDRQLLEFLCELYGMEAFDHLDQFITDNGLTADEIVLLPMGREVRYYG